MGVEIERKFLVTGDAWQVVPGTQMVQGYLNRDKSRTVRIRIAGELAYLTVKGISNGASRQEFEYPIPVADAQELIALCDGSVIRKVRRCVDVGGFTWEVDAFEGENAGLVVAEIELASKGQKFAKPDWIGTEVTDDPRYFNSSLSSYPFTLWPENIPTDNSPQK